jgi:hypothetical protein
MVQIVQAVADETVVKVAGNWSSCLLIVVWLANMCEAKRLPVRVRQQD